MSDTNTRAPIVWPCFSYADAHKAIRFLVEAFGFEERLVVPGEGEGVVAHAELAWPPGGGIMLGSAGRSNENGIDWPLSQVSVYCVTDEPDALFERATAHGAEVVLGLKDEDYGSRGFTVKDPEGNYWSFGTYAGS